MCVDEMGPKAPTIYPSPRWHRQGTRPRFATSHRFNAAGGYIFGALQPHTGQALTLTSRRRTIAAFLELLQAVEDWIAPTIERIYIVLDNLATHRLATHRAYDVLLFCLAHPRFEFVFQPVSCPYLNLIEPWWKSHHSLAFAGGQFDSWEEMEAASAKATAYWNEHKHPYRWGTRKRHKARKRYGVAAVPHPDTTCRMNHYGRANA